MKARKTRFGIVGTNFISDLMVEGGNLDPRFEAVAVFSRREETGRTFADRHQIERVYTSLEAMIADPDIDVVYIASPNAIHSGQAIKCLQRGKHVLCEKPLAANSDEVGHMIEAARQSDRLLMEAMLTTISPAFRVLVDNLYRVGVMRRYFASYCQYSSRYDKLKAGIVANAFKPELANGAVMDIGVYCLYPMVALFGAPCSVLSSSMKLSTGVDGQGSVIASYEGMDGVVMYSKIADSRLPLEIQGEDGILTLNHVNDPRTVTFIPRDKTKEPIVLINDTESNHYRNEISHFIDLIETGRTESPINSYANSLATIQVIDTIRAQRQ